MALAETLGEYVRACFTGVWLQSYEPDDALAEIGGLCRQEGWRLAVWDLERGLHVAGQSATTNAPASATDPLAAVRALGALADGETPALLVLLNFHRFLQSPEVVQALACQLSRGKQQRACLVILAPVVQLPAELDKQFVVLTHELPDRGQLQAVASGVATEPGELPEEPGLSRLLEAAAGLTRCEAENAFSLSLVRQGRLEPAVLWELKGQALQQGGLLTLHRGQEEFAGLGGLENLKRFCLRALRPTGKRTGRPRARGVCLLSPPGCGKSQFAKALGSETERPTAILDVGALLGSLVGQTEERTRQALRTVDALAPCVLMIDEIEKALSGGSGQGDSGVGARLCGTLLTWLNDHVSDVFVVCTANDITRLPPEFWRAERFDGVFFLDLPDAAQRQAIWAIYRREFALSGDEPPPNDEGWTGAEIRSCCRLAALLDLPLSAAAQNVVPIARTAGETIERLRQWASGRCLSADRPGIYQSTPASDGPRRRIGRPSAN